MAVSVIGAPLRTGRPSPAATILRVATAQGLVRFDAAGGIEPGLAARWIVREGNRSYIFRLREAVWPDGTPVEADAVVRQLRRAFADPANPLAPHLGAIEGIVAMTPQVIEVRVRHPRPDLLSLFAQAPLAVVAPGPRRTAGAGPFAVVDGGGAPGTLLRPVTPPGGEETPAPEDHVRLRGERAALAVGRFVARGSDLVLGGTLADWPFLQYANVPPASVRVDPAAGLFGLAIVARDGLLATPDGRAAIGLAIDAGAVTGALRDGWAADGALLPATLDAAADPAPSAWADVPPAQRADLARARVVAHGSPVRLRLALPQGPGMTRLYDLVGSSLARVGITLDRVAPGAPADLRLVDAVAPYASARWYLRTACQPCAAPVADAIAAARTAPTLAERARLLTQADRAIAADVAFVPLARPLRWSLVAPRLRAFTTNPRAVHPLNALRADPT